MDLGRIRYDYKNTNDSRRDVKELIASKRLTKRVKKKKMLPLTYIGFGSLSFSLVPSLTLSLHSKLDFEWRQVLTASQANGQVGIACALFQETLVKVPVAGSLAGSCATLKC